MVGFVVFGAEVLNKNEFAESRDEIQRMITRLQRMITCQHSDNTRDHSINIHVFIYFLKRSLTPSSLTLTP
jgi:hypothetical protein